MNKQILGVGIVALIIGAGIGYGGAHAFATKSAAPSFARGNFSGGTTGGTGAFRAGGAGAANAGGILSGTVASKDSESITLNTRDGSSHVVLVTPETTVSKSVDGSLADVSVGATVTVSGSTNTDGSTSATMIQLRPAGTPTAGAPMMPAGAQ